MKVIVGTKDLKSAVEKVLPALPVKAQTPIQACIFFKAAGDTLELQTNNFATAIKVVIPAEAEEEGEILTAGKNFAEIIAKLSGGITTLETRDGNLIIKSDATKFEIFTSDTEDFAKLAFDDPTLDIFVDALKLKHLIRRTTFACAEEKDGRPLFQGVNFVFAPNKITAVSTNTHRFAAVSVSADLSELADNAVMLIPAAVLDSASRLFGEGTVHIQANDHAVMFELENFKMTARLVDGTFPPYDKIIPKDCETYATVDVKEFTEAISRVEVIARQSENNTVKLKFSNDGLEISASSYEAGRVVEHLNAEVEGRGIWIAFNLRYVKEFLKIQAAPYIRIGMNEKMAPAIFNFCEQEHFIYIITPVRTE